MSIFVWTLIIAVVTAVACGLCGVFLVVKREAFISEGLSHSVLPGIIVAYLLFQDRNSPWLLLFAAVSGMLMVLLVQALSRTRLVDQDASLGVVFSALFSIGVILASHKLGNVHFHADCIIDGNLATAALTQFQVGSISLGPKSFVIMTSILIAIVLFVVAFFKELKLMAFDESLARTQGFRPVWIHLGWLSLVSLTAVAAFEIAGTVLVVALMVAPATTACLLTNRLSFVFSITALIAAAASVAGTYLGWAIDISPAGPIAMMTGLIFLITAAFAPRYGFLGRCLSNRSNRNELAQQIFLTTVHGNESISMDESLQKTNWTRRRFNSVKRICVSNGWITETELRLKLTLEGRHSVEEHLAKNGFVANPEC